MNKPMPTPTDCRRCGRPYYGAAGLLCEECERESKRPLDAAACSVDSGKLTPEQIKTWRNVLVGMIGPYALLMPDEDVQKIRDNMQAQFSEPNIPAHPPR